MSPEIHKPSRSIPSQEALAEKAKELAVYVFQEGTEKQQADLIQAMNGNKLAAWIEKARLDPSQIFREAVDRIKVNPAGKVRRAIHKLLSEKRQYLTLREFKEVHGLSSEQIVKDGRRELSKALDPTLNRPLREQEIQFLEDMAEVNPDQGVMEKIFKHAEREQRLALRLTYNPAITKSLVNRLVEVSLKNMPRDTNWSLVVIELIANPDLHALLSPSSLLSIESDPEVGGFLRRWNQGGANQAKVIDLPVSQKKKQHFLAERQAKPTQGKVRTATDWNEGGPSDKAVNY